MSVHLSQFKGTMYILERLVRVTIFMDSAVMCSDAPISGSHDLHLCFQNHTLLQCVYVTTLTIITKQWNVWGNYFPLSQPSLFLYCKVLCTKHVNCIAFFSLGLADAQRERGDENERK